MSDVIIWLLRCTDRLTVILEEILENNSADISRSKKGVGEGPSVLHFLCDALQLLGTILRPLTQVGLGTLRN